MSGNYRPPYNPGEVLQLQVDDLNHRGEGVGKANGFTLFVDGALPGETVQAKINKVHKKYGEASLLSLKDKSPHRVNPPCPHFPRCGGCQIQHLAYKEQLAWKQKRIKETLKRIANLEEAENITHPVLGMEEPWHYRNKTRIHFALSGNRIIAGFYQKQSRRIIDIGNCRVQHPSADRMIAVLREAIRQHTGLKNNRPGRKGNTFLPVEEADIRTSFHSGNCLVTLFPPSKMAKKSPGYLKEHYKKLAGLIGKISDIPLAGITLYRPGKEEGRYLTLLGEPCLEEVIPPFQYRLSPASFFQVNPQQAAVLYEQAVVMAGSPHTAFDLYCGTGNFSLYLGRTAEEVIGVDSEAAAIRDAGENAVLNEMLNLRFIHARAEECPDLLDEGRQPKAIFLNPPRRGCSPELLKAVIGAGPERLIYVSCNPATLARDLNYLSEYEFTARAVQPVDMFPHTGHVESIALVKKEGSS